MVAAETCLQVANELVLNKQDLFYSIIHIVLVWFYLQFFREWQEVWRKLDVFSLFNEQNIYTVLIYRKYATCVIY